MVAVGCLFIKSGEGSAKELLRDLVEVRGLLGGGGEGLCDCVVGQGAEACEVG